MIGRPEVVLLLLCACGAGPHPLASVTERFEAPEAQSARQRAPDMVGAAERARRDAERAEQAGDEDAAQDHATRARLLLSAAVAESERIDLEQRRLSAEARESAAQERFAGDSRERHRVDEELHHLVAARVAAEQASAALALAQGDEARRHHADASDRARLHREAAAVITRRARLVLAAARAMEADGSTVSEAERRIGRVADARDDASSLRLAQAALGAAMRALGSARARRPGPTREERAALMDAAREAGFEVEQRESGLVVRAAPVFRGRARRPFPAARARLESLAAIALAQPHGAVQVQAFSTRGSGAASRRVAEARAASVVQALVDLGVPAERLQAAGVVDADDPEGTQVELLFLAYAPPPP